MVADNILKGILSLLMSLLMVSSAFAQTSPWIWSLGAGGSSYEYGAGIGLDAQGNSYVAGTFYSSSITLGNTVLTNKGNSNFYIVKTDPGGNVAWARSYGGTDYDYATSIAVDGSGNCYVAGGFSSSSISLGALVLTNSAVVGSDMFVVKLDPNGYPVWAASAAGNGDDHAVGIAVDAFGNVDVTGSFSSATLTVGSFVLTNTASAGSDVFTAKYDPYGIPKWARSGGGGSAADFPGGIAADASGNTYVTGTYESPTITFGAVTLSNNGSSDMFVVKYDTGGTVLWGRSAGGSAYDYGNTVAVDGSGNLYVSGQFGSTSITFGSTTLTSNGLADIYLVKYNSAGTVIWAKGAGGSQADYGSGLAGDVAGNIYLVGSFSSATASFGSRTITNNGNADIFVAKYDASGNVLWAQSAGGNDYDDGNAIAVDASGGFQVAGEYGSASITFGTTTLTNAGGYDLFIARNANPSPQLVKVKDVPNDQGGKLFVTWKSSPLDVQPSQLINEYVVYRGISAANLPSASPVRDLPEYEQESPTPWLDDKMRNTYASGKFEGVPDDIYWQNIGIVNPEFLGGYYFEAPTPSDSGPQGNSTYYFMVRAVTKLSGIFGNSNIDSGHSVDNLPPGAVPSLSAVVLPGPSVALHWPADLADPDLGYYEVHRSTTDGFVPGPSTMFGRATDTTLLDNSPAAGQTNYYRVLVVDIHGNHGAPSPQASSSTSTTQTFSLADKWNMISVPLSVADYHVSALYPSAITSAFAYAGGYQLTSLLANGTGYWLKFNGAQNVIMTGNVRGRDTIDVNAGWNLIGSISQSVPVASIISLTPGMTASKFFAYAGVYASTTTIDPGRGYWVKVNQPGKLVLASAESADPVSRLAIALPDEDPPPAPENDLQEGAPSGFSLSQNYPNPFNPSTEIGYDLPRAGFVSLKIYDVVGRDVATLVEGEQSAGHKSVVWDAANAPSGVYYYRLTAGGFTAVKKLTIVR